MSVLFIVAESEPDSLVEFVLKEVLRYSHVSGFYKNSKKSEKQLREEIKHDLLEKGTAIKEDIEAAIKKAKEAAIEKAKEATDTEENEAALKEAREAESFYKVQWAQNYLEKYIDDLEEDVLEAYDKEVRRSNNSQWV